MRHDGLMARVLPPLNTKALLASVQYNNRKDRREERKENSERDGRVCACVCETERELYVLSEPPVVL